MKNRILWWFSWDAYLLIALDDVSDKYETKGILYETEKVYTGQLEKEGCVLLRHVLVMMYTKIRILEKSNRFRGTLKLMIS
jgi:hypothetical protein